MKLRQCVFVCKDLEDSREELCETLGIEVAYRDPGVAKWGLANVVCPTGHDFLEIVSPTRDGGARSGSAIRTTVAPTRSSSRTLSSIAAAISDSIATP